MIFWLGRRMNDFLGFGDPSPQMTYWAILIGASALIIGAAIFSSSGFFGL